jgi:HAD superfamily hydrolase (TIGR01509 family)
VAQLIDDLHARGLHTGVLSNTNACHWRQLVSGEHGPAKFPTVEKARHVHASHLLGLIKPDRAIFERFCAVTGFGPEEVVFFDDMAENVEGAIATGWDAVPIDHTGDTASQIRMHLRMRGIDV